MCLLVCIMQLDALLDRHVPEAELLSRAGGEIAYRLPKGDAARCSTASLSILMRFITCWFL